MNSTFKRRRNFTKTRKSWDHFSGFSKVGRNRSISLSKFFTSTKVSMNTIPNSMISWSNPKSTSISWVYSSLRAWSYLRDVIWHGRKNKKMRNLWHFGRIFWVSLSTKSRKNSKNKRNASTRPSMKGLRNMKSNKKSKTCSTSHNKNCKNSAKKSSWCWRILVSVCNQHIGATSKWKSRVNSCSCNSKDTFRSINKTIWKKLKNLRKTNFSRNNKSSQYRQFSSLSLL